MLERSRSLSGSPCRTPGVSRAELLQAPTIARLSRKSSAGVRRTPARSAARLWTTSGPRGEADATNCPAPRPLAVIARAAWLRTGSL